MDLEARVPPAYILWLAGCCYSLFLSIVESTNHDLAFCALANVFRGRLDLVGEQGEPCRAFYRVHCINVPLAIINGRRDDPVYQA